MDMQKAESQRLNSLPSSAINPASVLQSLGELVFVFDEEGRYLSIWGTDESQLFLPREQLIGRRITEVLAPEIAEACSGALRDALRENKSREFVYSGKPYAKKKWFRGRMNPIETAPGEQRLAILIIHDITEQHNLEAELRQARAAQVSSARMAALGEMAGGVAHEINNPLTIIQVKTSIIAKTLEKSENPPDPRILESLAKIDETCERISKIVKGLRAFSRNADSDPLLPTDIRSVIEDVLTLCRERFYHKGVRVELDASSSPVCDCRGVQIGQVLLNLLNNAFDAVCDRPDPWIRIHLRENLQMVTVAITDSGPGVPEEIRSRIMEPFFTTKEVGKGTGLGLSISKGLIEQHGGFLVQDTSKPHTTFLFCLPKILGCLPGRRP